MATCHLNNKWKLERKSNSQNTHTFTSSFYISLPQRKISLRSQCHMMSPGNNVLDFLLASTEKVIGRETPPECSICFASLTSSYLSLTWFTCNHEQCPFNWRCLAFRKPFIRRLAQRLRSAARCLIKGHFTRSTCSQATPPSPFFNLLISSVSDNAFNHQCTSVDSMIHSWLNSREQASLLGRRMLFNEFDVWSQHKEKNIRETELRPQCSFIYFFRAISVCKFTNACESRRFKK